MGQMSGATNTQKTVMLSLAEGWMLRYVDLHGWCLFMPNRSRPFARVKKRTVDEMTAKGWLTPGIATKGLGYRPAKELTALGRKYADRLLGKKWGSEDEWDPFDQRAAKKAPKTARSSDSDSAVPLMPMSKSDIIIEPLNPPAASPLHTNAQGAPHTYHTHENGEFRTSAHHSSDESDSAMPLNGESDDDHGGAPRFRLVA